MKELLKKTADKMIQINKTQVKEECPISIIDIEKWEWAQGVGLYGLYRYHKVLGESEYLGFLVNWYKSRIAEGLPEKNVNTCAPMLTLTYIYEETRDGDFLKYIKEWAEWVYNEMPRTEDGGLQHITMGIENKGQLWADTLFMTNLFLARAGVLLGIDEYVDESKRQFLIHIKYLFDKSCGLWYHGWSFLRRDNFSAVHWGRGNCWYTAGVVDYLEMINAEPFLKKYLIDTLRAQADALLKYQCADGMWRTVIDDETSYEETSATAGFAYGLLKAVREGYLGREYKLAALKALKAVTDRIDSGGTVLEVSYGTPVFENAEDYKKVEKCPMTYGQALAILCMSEGLKTEM